MSKCAAPSCPCVPSVDVCTVHRPADVVERIKKIMKVHFEAARRPGDDSVEMFQRLWALHDAIVRDVENTI